MKLKDGLYHKLVFLPKINKIDADYPCVYTKHARESALTDKYGVIILPKSYNLANSDIIELEIKNNDINKLVIRTPYNNKYDLTIVISFYSGMIKTVWLNKKDDNHDTLDKNKYIKESEAYIN